MARLGCTRSGVGAYRDPETGKLWQLDEDIPEDVAGRAVESHDVFYVEESESEAHHCGINGCKRTVDSPADTCWQHQDNES